MTPTPTPRKTGPSARASASSRSTCRVASERPWRGGSAPSSTLPPGRSERTGSTSHCFITARSLTTPSVHSPLRLPPTPTGHHSASSPPRRAASAGETCCGWASRATSRRSRRCGKTSSQPPAGSERRRLPSPTTRRPSSSRTSRSPGSEDGRARRVASSSHDPSGTPRRAFVADRLTLFESAGGRYRVLAEFPLDGGAGRDRAAAGR